MKQKASAAIAVIGPVLVITILSAVTWQMYKFKELHFDMISYALWILAMGLLVALYLVLTLAVLPKYATPTLVTCAVMGAIFALVLAVIDWFGFYIPQPIRLESLTTLNLTGVLVVGNILLDSRAFIGLVGNLACAVLARRGCAGTE